MLLDYEHIGGLILCMNTEPSDPITSEKPSADHKPPARESVGIVSYLRNGHREVDTALCQPHQCDTLGTGWVVSNRESL